MKKIAILVDLELSETSGGHVKFWERICSSIKDSIRNIDLTVFFLGKKSSKKKIGKNITFYTIKPIISSNILRPLGVDADSTDLFPINFKLLYLLRNYDLVHSTDQLFSMARTAIICSKLWSIPLTTSLHTDTPSYTEYYVKKIFKNFPKIIFKIFIERLRIHKKIPNNQRIKLRNYLKYCEEGMINDQLTLSKFSFPKNLENKISRLSRGVDKKVFYKRKINKDKLFMKYSIDKDEKILFFCGRVHELKGAIFLAKVHDILRKKKVKVVSIFAGEDIHGEKCLSIGGDKIKLVGHLRENEISELYNLCDLFVFPSKFEIGPQVVLEAKACGTICVVSPEGGGKRIKETGLDGIIIDEYHPNVWANTIIKLLFNKKKINFMRNMILSEFQPHSWEHIFNKYFIKKWNKILK